MAQVAPPPVPRKSRAFWVFWSFDAIIAAVVVFFFLWGLSDGTVSSFNITLWLVALAAVGGVVFGSLALHRAGHSAPALLVLMTLAIPGLLFILFFGAVLILQPRWN